MAGLLVLPGSAAAEVDTEAGEPEGDGASEAVPAPAVRHWSARTGWVRAVEPGQPIASSPSTEAVAEATAPSITLAAQVQRLARDAEGAVWVRVNYPNGGPRGWVPASALRAVSPFRPLSRSAERRLDRLVALAGPRTGVVVRDKFGRTLYSGGTRRPLILASVTKLFTVAAGLDRFGARVGARSILAPSDNFRAQVLMNRLGGGVNTRGTSRAGDYAAGLGADVRLADGSGLSYSNRAPAHEVVDFLERVRDVEHFGVFRAGLPVAGLSGTLAGRLREPATRGRVRAKTGTLDPVATLAGYVRPRGIGLGPHRELVFAILMNRIHPPTGRAIQDRMLRALVVGP